MPGVSHFYLPNWCSSRIAFDRVNIPAKAGMQNYVISCYCQDSGGGGVNTAL